ncbi:MAG: hypothetical protein AAF542_19565 [Pseudomonadota bacterium]
MQPRKRIQHQEKYDSTEHEQHRLGKCHAQPWSQHPIRNIGDQSTDEGILRVKRVHQIPVSRKKCIECELRNGVHDSIDTVHKFPENTRYKAQTVVYMTVLCGSVSEMGRQQCYIDQIRSRYA